MKFIEPKEQDWSVKIKEDGKEFQARPSLELSVNILSVASGKRQDEIFSNFEKAFSMISQTRIGQYLMEKAISAGAEIIVDDNEFVNNNNLTGFVTRDNIYIKSNYSPAKLANILIHELTHIMQSSYVAKGKYLHDLRLDQAIQLEWALEAEAYASTVQFAAELSRGDPKAPIDAWKSDDCLDLLENSDALAYLVAKTANDEEIYSGQHMTSQFLLFYSNSYLRSAYAAHVIEYFEKIEDNFDVILKTLSFRKKLDGSRLKDEFNYVGKSYLTEHAKDTDIFSSDYYSSIPQNLKERVLDFYDRLPKLTHFFQKKSVKNLKTYEAKDIEPKPFNLAEQALKKYTNNHGNN